jgi:MFS transporter, PPP family, 3-phenylpropionic acid transporter
VRGRLLPVSFYYFTSFAALGIYAPFFPRWLEGRGVEGLRMGAVAALLPAMGVLGPPLVGLAADALGLRGHVLRLACLGSAVSFALVGAAWASGRGLSYAELFAAVLVFAVFRSPMVMMADVVTMERAPAAGTTYGAVRLWGSVGFLLAALAAGRWLDPAAPAALPGAVAAALLVSLVAAWGLPTSSGAPRLPVAGEARALLGAADYRVFLLVSLLAQTAHASYDLCFTLHLLDLGAGGALVGAAWAAGVVFEVALMAFSDRLLARSPAPRILALTLLGAAARWALIARVRSLPALLALQPLHAVSFALWWVASLRYVKDRAPARALATAQGLFMAATALGSVTGMLAWGPLYRRAGGGPTFGAAAIVAGVACALAVAWGRRLAVRK